MNSKDYRNIREAYLQVYGNDIREKLEFESWVNNLLEEGYDLSDYTWDELYENYTQLDEISIGMKRRAADASVDKVKKAGERFRSSTSVDVQPYLMKKKDKAEAQHLRLAKAAESYDLYDLILSHLIDEGYADTQEAAERIMVNMSEDWRESIVETRMDPRGRPASGPMNVYANPKGKPSQAHLDAVKSYEDEQRKKTPEQRKAEQDAYRERQMNNK